jgi:hypothetical protein
MRPTWRSSRMTSLSTCQSLAGADHESARSSHQIFLCIDERGVYVLGRFSVFEARKPCAVASFSHM